MRIKETAKESIERMVEKFGELIELSFHDARENEVKSFDSIDDFIAALKNASSVGNFVARFDNENKMYQMIKGFELNVIEFKSVTIL